MGQHGESRLAVVIRLHAASMLEVSPIVVELDRRKHAAMSAQERIGSGQTTQHERRYHCARAKHTQERMRI